MQNVKYKKKNYVHFDRIKGIDESRKWIESPKNIERHDFMPFIRFRNTLEKYSAQSGRKTKPRDLAYCSHIDAYIYQLYAHKMMKLYNNIARDYGINNCVTAYRNVFRGKCNIHFADDVFRFIRSKDNCFIIIGDFTKFFDRLDHEYLKKQCCKVLGVQELPNDYYKVFRSITKYSYFELDDLIKLTGSKNHKDFNDNSKRDMALDLKQFREAKTNYLRKNWKSYGIPQGSPLSALFANVYMLDFDKAINNFVTSNKGLYRRYSDDFIIVLPSDSRQIVSQWQHIDEVLRGIPKLDLQPTKTRVFHYAHGKLESQDKLLFPSVEENGKMVMDYLGFSFDGEKISIRDKTVSKYYYRMRRRARVVGYRSKGIGRKKRPDYHGLYKTYTHFGAKPSKGKKGNFITYVNRCIDVFGMDERVHLVKQRHMQKMVKLVKHPYKKRRRVKQTQATSN